MKKSDIIRQRLVSQKLSDTDFSKSVEVVEWMCAIQAQDYAMAKWGIGCRANRLGHDEVESDFNEGRILRTHLLRPTWHFIVPKDIRWLLALTAPRIKAASRYHHQKFGIDHAVLKKSKRIIENALTSNEKLTREGIAKALGKEKIDTTEYRISYYLMNAELDGQICSAGRIGKQFAYALLERIVPRSNPLTRNEAISELTRKYFRSRGPATVQDFAWWSGLTLEDAKKGIELNYKTLTHALVGDNNYWFSPDTVPLKPLRKKIYLLPAFDEYAVGYKDRNDILNPEFTYETSWGLKPLIISSGHVIGTWKPIVKKNHRSIEQNLLGDSSVSNGEVLSAGKRYFAFYS